MEHKKAEVERLFEVCRDAHNECVRIARFTFVVGCIAALLCCSSMVILAWKGRYVYAFIQAFLFLFNANLAVRNRKLNKKEMQDWIAFEARHNFVMENWEELTAAGCEAES